jgi:hypothetical protein
MYKVWFLLNLPFEPINFSDWCDLHKSFIFGVMWAFNCNECGHKILLWRSSKWKIEVTFQIVGTNGQGDGSRLEESYLHLHKAFANLRPCYWSRVPKIDLSPLQYELEAENAHWRATNVNFYTGHEWIEGILVETLKPLQYVEGNSEIPKTWIFGWNFW